MLLIIVTLCLTHVKTFTLQNNEVDNILFLIFLMRKGSTEDLSDFTTTVYAFCRIVLNSHRGPTGGMNTQDVNMEL